jgi:hypothetical protein
VSRCVTLPGLRVVPLHVEDSKLRLQEVIMQLHPRLMVRRKVFAGGMSDVGAAMPGLAASVSAARSACSGPCIMCRSSPEPAAE